MKQINVAAMKLLGERPSSDVQVYTSSVDDLPIVIDTGASVILTSSAADFVGPIASSHKSRIKGLNSTTTVAGVGTIEWSIQDALGTIRVIRTKAYYVPDASIRLFSPQKYFQGQQHGHLHADKDSTSLELADGTCVRFPYQHGSCLPIMLTTNHFSNSFATVGLTFSDIMTPNSVNDTRGLLNVTDAMNVNLTAPQRELKLWHDRLCHCDMQRIQDFAVDRTAYGDQQIIKPRHNGVSSCTRSLCFACQLGKQTRILTGAHHQLPTSSADSIRADDLRPGDAVSIDQYISSVRGRHGHTAGKEPKHKKLSGGTLFYDHTTQLITLHHQISLRVGETIRLNHLYEGYCKERRVTVCHYHADNMPFGSQ